jgi:MFS family permease
MTIMAGATIAPSLPAMKTVFADTTYAELGVRLVLTITALAIAIAAPFAGVLGDRIGRARVLMASIALYAVAGTAGLYISDLNVLLASRVLLGFAVAGVMTSTTALIGDPYFGEHRGKMLGLQGAATGFGGVVFLVLGGLLAEISWRGPFWIYLLPVLLLIFVPRAQDLWPQKASAPSSYGSSPPQTKRELWLIYAAAFLGMIAFYAVPVQLPFLLTERGLTAPSFSGYAIAGMTLVSALIGMAYGQLSSGQPKQRLAAIAFGFMGLGLSLVWLGSVIVITALGLIAIGIGMGLLMPTLSGWLLGLASLPTRGRVMGGLAAAIFLGQFVSPLALQPIIVGTGLASAFLATSALCLVLSIGLLVTKAQTP